jgi:NADPH2:quinone reductase
VSRTQLEDTIKLVDRGRLKPRIAKVLPLEDIALAHQLVESGALSGRVVVKPS